MKTVQARTKAGTMIHIPVFNKAFERRAMSGDGTGLCIACGQEASGVEPDARRYTCESCSAPKVFGLEELVLMGLIRE